MEERKRNLHIGYLIAIVVPIIAVVLLIIFWPSGDGGNGNVTPTPTSTTTSTATPAATVTATPTSTPASAVTVSINVSETIDKSAEKDFHVYVDITDVSNFAGAQYDIAYDPDVLRILEVSAGKVGGATIPIEEWQLVPTMTQGTARILNSVDGASGVDGEGYVADILFRVVGYPGDSSAISFVTVSGDTESSLRVGDSDAEEIPASWVDGVVTIE